MLECINKECLFNKERECKSGVVDEKCVRRIKPTETPTYAEEQLENTKEKTPSYQGEHIEDIKGPINYEEEYNKLKKELEAKEITLKSTQELAEHEKENSCKLQEEINNLNEIIDKNCNEIDKVTKLLNDGFDERLKLKADNELLESQLENELNRNRVLKDKIEVEENFGNEYAESLKAEIVKRNAEIENLQEENAHLKEKHKGIDIEKIKAAMKILIELL